MEPKDILTKEFLIEEYINKKKSVGTIAKENNIASKTSVTQAIARHELYRDSNRNASKILTKDFLIDNYIKNQKSLKEICKLIGIKNRTSVKIALLRHNIPIRKHTKSESYIKGMKGRRAYEEIAGHYWCSLKASSKSRNLEFNITLEYIWKLFIKQNRKCALSNVDLKFNDICNDPTTQTASLDRIDSSKGYIIGNVQWVHKTVNRIKSDLNQDEFINWCNKITNHMEK